MASSKAIFVRGKKGKLSLGDECNLATGADSPPVTDKCGLGK